MGISENIRQRRRLLGLTLEDVAAMVGVNRQTMSRYETGGIKNIPSDRIELLAAALDTSPAELMGWVGTPEPPALKNVIPMPKTYKVPLVGAIACGKPILAVEEAEETVDVPEWVHADFALTCKGDSMINARIFDGDIVYIRQQREVENGQIAAVRIGEDATLKKVYYAPGSGRLTLRACNPLYDDMIYTGPELDEVEVLGLAVGFYSAVRYEQ